MARVWPHGYISLEFILIGALGLFLPRKVAFALLCIDSLADFIYAICYAYQFSLGNLLSSLRYLSVLPRGRVAEGLALLPVVLLVCAALSLVRPLPDCGFGLRVACWLLSFFFSLWKFSADRIQFGTEVMLRSSRFASCAVPF